MMRFVAVISFVSLLFIGCGEEKDFMTHSDEIAVIDISSKDILLNGEKIGDTFNDIEKESQTLMIRSLEQKIKMLNADELQQRRGILHSHLQRKEAGIPSEHRLYRRAARSLSDGKGNRTFVVRRRQDKRTQIPGP